MSRGSHDSDKLGEGRAFRRSLSHQAGKAPHMSIMRERGSKTTQRHQKRGFGAYDIRTSRDLFGKDLPGMKKPMLRPLDRACPHDESFAKLLESRANES